MSSTINEDSNVGYEHKSITASQLQTVEELERALSSLAVMSEVIAPRYTQSEPPITDIDENTGRTFQFTADPEKLKYASAFEQSVWFEEGYGSLEGYAEHIANSRTFTAFDGEECIGIARLFSGTAILPPFVTEMPFYNNEVQKKVIKICTAGEAEELGTIAVAKSARNGLVFENLARLAYRDAYYGREMKYWGIIMEPIRVRRMNRHYGFTFNQLGPEIDYQGGMCAAHIMDLKEVNANMSQKFPDIYDWFVNEPLNSEIKK